MTSELANFRLCVRDLSRVNLTIYSPIISYLNYSYDGLNLMIIIYSLIVNSELVCTTD